ncbi:MAG: hypothetical protein NTV39_01685 [Candidatus Saccharibacteria bacterium]|nr:hypothetical protein [Candidatus Saccharibacteria bacterium]
MGKRLRVVSDPSKDVGHEAGAVIEFMQPSETQLGSVLTKRQMHWEHHADAVTQAYNKLDYFQNKILLTKPDTGNYRHIRDDRILGKIYISGSDLVNHTYLLYRHLSHWIISTVHVWPDSTQADKDVMAHFESRTIDYESPLNYVVKDILKREDLFQHKGYAFITGEWKEIRHALYHPTHQNIYNSSLDLWDKVPIAWFTSGKFRDQYKEIVAFHNELIEGWCSLLPNYKRPGNITITHIGATSEYPSQIKKARAKK